MVNLLDTPFLSRILNSADDFRIPFPDLFFSGLGCKYNRKKREEGGIPLLFEAILRPGKISTFPECHAEGEKRGIFARFFPGVGRSYN